jgi:hypothetical protein
MTMIDPRALDLAGFDRPVEGHRGDSSDLHFLRLALELQLDALLLTLGGAAHAAAHAEPEPDGGRERPLPWQRWLVEDLEQARELAAALIASDDPSVPALGGGLADFCTDASLDNLSDHYTSLERLLAGVASRPSSGATGLTALEALTRCRARLAEVHALRRSTVVTAGMRGMRGQSFLPGELLG